LKGVVIEANLCGSGGRIVGRKDGPRASNEQQAITIARERAAFGPGLGLCR
jgi:hypothetical protein